MAEKPDKDSLISISSAANIFDFDPVNVTNSKSVYKEFISLNPVHEPPITFKIPPSSSYPDFANSFILTEIQVMKQGTGDAAPVPIETTDNISLCQAIGATWIKNFKMMVRGRETNNPNNLNAFKNIFDIELNYSKECKNTHLAMMGYYPDGTDQNAVGGAGFEARRTLITGGKHAELITRLNADACNIDKYWLNNTEVDFEIFPNDANFCIIAPALTAGTRVFFTIKKCRMFILYHDMYDGLNTDIQNRLNHSSAKYAMKRTELKSVYLEANRTDLSVNIFNEQIPTRIVVGMLDRDDFNGNIETSPFNFKPFDIREIHVEWNGQQFPHVLYDMNFNATALKVTRPYYDMCHALGNGFTNKSNGITMADFVSGKTIFVFDMTSSLENNGGSEIIRQGTTSLHARFLNPLTTGIVMVIYAEFDSLLMINKNRIVTTDLTA